MPRRLAPLLSSALAALILAGCGYSTKKPDPEPRYRNLGTKADFPGFLDGTILQEVDVGGVDNLTVSGYGLVVNLENTGRNDGIPTPVRDAISKTGQIRGLGSELTDGALGDLSVGQLLADPRTAIVRVDAIIPPGATAGDRVDVRVSTLDSNSTVSLARGELWQTELFRGIVNAQSPGERVNLAGLARGPLLVNPVYALLPPQQVKDDPAARGSLRSAYIPDGGMVQQGRFFILRLRQPSYRVSRTIEQRLNYHFGAPVAAAQDEGRIQLSMPADFRGDYGRFLGVATTLYAVGGDPAYSLQRAKDLAAAAQEPERTPDELLAISYAWEGLGSAAAPVLLPLLSDPRPGIAYFAARAASFNNQPAAVDTLARIAGDPANPYNVAAVETLGKLKPNADLLRRVRDLLAAESPGVRVAAYQSLDRLGDVGKSIYRIRVGEQFLLDIVDSSGPPVVWASRSGTPRIAVIGQRPTLRSPMLLTAFGDRLSVNVPGPGQPANIFYRPVTARPGTADVRPELVELLARLGGERPPGEATIRLTYGDVLAVLKALGDDGQLAAGGRPVPVVLQDVASEVVQDAPIIPGLERLADSDPIFDPAPEIAPAPTPAAAPSLLPVLPPDRRIEPGAAAARTGLSSANP